jgi:hypothetical protein
VVRKNNFTNWKNVTTTFLMASHFFQKKVKSLFPKRGQKATKTLVIWLSVMKTFVIPRCVHKSQGNIKL